MGIRKQHTHIKWFKHVRRPKGVSGINDKAQINSLMEQMTPSGSHKTRDHHYMESISSLVPCLEQFLQHCMSYSRSRGPEMCVPRFLVFRDPDAVFVSFPSYDTMTLFKPLFR
jgi:hypothetical protein